VQIVDRAGDSSFHRYAGQVVAAEHQIDSQPWEGGPGAEASVDDASV
jgi:hypothetical protein